VAGENIYFYADNIQIWIDPLGLQCEYVKKFLIANPKFKKFIGKNKMEIHHRMPQVLYKNDILKGDPHRLSNLYAVPKELHRKFITPQWNKFLKTNPKPAEIMKFAIEMDKKIAQFINVIGR